MLSSHHRLRGYLAHMMEKTYNSLICILYDRDFMSHFSKDGLIPITLREQSFLVYQKLNIKSLLLFPVKILITPSKKYYGRWIS